MNDSLIITNFLNSIMMLSHSLYIWYPTDQDHPCQEETTSALPMVWISTPMSTPNLALALMQNMWEKGFSILELCKGQRFSIVFHPTTDKNVGLENKGSIFSATFIMLLILILETLKYAALAGLLYCTVVPCLTIALHYDKSASRQCFCGRNCSDFTGMN